MALLNNNSVESWGVNTVDRTGTASIDSRLLVPGHRTDVRTVSFSSDNTAMLTASSDAVKIWNRLVQRGQIMVGLFFHFIPVNKLV